MPDLHGGCPGMRVGGRGQDRPGPAGVPGPGVAEPNGRQHVQGCRRRAGVGELDGHQDVVRVSLGVVHLDHPVPVVEDAGVQQLVLGVRARAGCVTAYKILIRVRGLRIVIAPPVPCVAGDRVQVPPVLLYVLAVVALSAGQAERAFLEDRVAAVPQRERQTQLLLDVAEPGQTVLAPAVGPGAGVVMRQVVPGVAVRAVVLADRAPLPLADVRAPLVPLARLAQAVLEVPEAGHPLALGAHVRDVTWPRVSQTRGLLCLDGEA